MKNDKTDHDKTNEVSCNDKPRFITAEMIEVIRKTDLFKAFGHERTNSSVQS